MAVIIKEVKEKSPKKTDIFHLYEITFDYLFGKQWVTRTEDVVAYNEKQAKRKVDRMYR
jgi:hypothetical protein